MGQSSNPAVHGWGWPSSWKVQTVDELRAGGEVLVPSRDVSLPVPVRRDGQVRLAFMNLGVTGPWREDYDKKRHFVFAPSQVREVDLATGRTLLHPWSENEKLFGIANPPDGVVGCDDDPTLPPREGRLVVLARVYVAMNVLIPFFADETRELSSEAVNAARDVRDYFPFACEPGLWPYYKALGQTFFAWAERIAVREKAPLPWPDQPGAWAPEAPAGKRCTGLPRRREPPLWQRIKAANRSQVDLLDLLAQAKALAFAIDKDAKLLGVRAEKVQAGTIDTTPRSSARVRLTFRGSDARGPIEMQLKDGDLHASWSGTASAGVPEPTCRSAQAWAAVVRDGVDRGLLADFWLASNDWIVVPSSQRPRRVDARRCALRR